jgi:hypothetical protein
MTGWKNARVQWEARVAMEQSAPSTHSTTVRARTLDSERGLARRHGLQSILDLHQLAGGRKCGQRERVVAHGWCASRGEARV